jgi:hypothetical protein
MARLVERFELGNIGEEKIADPKNALSELIKIHKDYGSLVDAHATK